MYVYIGIYMFSFSFSFFGGEGAFKIYLFHIICIFSVVRDHLVATILEDKRLGLNTDFVVFVKRFKPNVAIVSFHQIFTKPNKTVLYITVRAVRVEETACRVCDAYCNEGQVPLYITSYQKNLSLFLWNIYQAENNFSICFKFTFLFGNTLLWIFQKQMHKGMHINCFGEFINFNRSTQILCHVFYNIHLFTSPDNIEVCFYH